MNKRQLALGTSASALVSQRLRELTPCTAAALPPSRRLAACQGGQAAAEQGLRAEPWPSQCVAFSVRSGDSVVVSVHQHASPLRLVVHQPPVTLLWSV